MTDTAIAKKADTSTKLKGFGSSDASAIIHFAATGEINNVLLRRISEIKGIVPRLNIYSKYFGLGDTVEADYVNNFFGHEKESNPYRSLPKQTYKNFVVSNHIDLICYIKDQFTGRVTESWQEIKATKDDIKTTLRKYLPQLAQHKLIMDSVSEFNEIYLIHYDTSDIYQAPERYKYDSDKITEFMITNECDLLIQMLKEGYQKLDNQWDEIPVYVEKEVLQLSESESKQIQAIESLNDALLLKAFAEKQINSFKESLKNNMEANGIKSIKTPMFTISYKDEFVRQSISSDEVKKAHPDDYQKFYKSSNVKSSIAIKLNSK